MCGEHGRTTFAMSRAFVKEQDGSDIPEDIPERPVSEHPNFVTKRGLQLIEQQIRELQETREAVKQRDDATALAHLERDLRYWLKRKSSAKLVEAEAEPKKVRFGVRAFLRYADGREQSFALVGEDEADPANGLISWMSPIAQALLGCEVGDEPLLQGERAEILRLEPVE
jgi:transcription elongation GreA/GreB family factor